MSGLEPEQRLQEVDQELPNQPGVVSAETKGFRVPQQLVAFKHRNYRLFFSGQLISLTGTWLQQVAESWLVLELVSKAKAELTMGVISAIGALPFLMFSFFGGVIADRFSKRNLLVATQSWMMAFAFVLAALIHFHIITIYEIAAIEFLLGTANAFDAPTRQAFVVEMVGREDLPNAIALNSAMFNGARIVGPAIAGVVIALVGTAGAFFLNGLSFIAVIAGLLMMRVNRVIPKVGRSAWLEFKEGVRFIRRERMITGLLILTGIISIFATSYAVLLPIFARYHLHQNARGLGIMFTAVGCGALIGAITLSSLGDFPWKGKLLLIGNLVFCVALVLFAHTNTLAMAIFPLLGVGWGMMTNMALTNTLIQTSVPDELRGRVLSVYTFMFMGMTPIGSLQAGVVAHELGVSTTIQIGAVVCGVAAILLSPRFIRNGTRANAG